MFDQTPVGPVEQGHRRQRRRLAQQERLRQVVERQAGVDDVLDQQDVPPVDAQGQILQQPDLASAAAVSVVAGECNEIQVVDDRKSPGQVGDEDERRRQRRNEDRLAAVVVGGDLGSEFADPALDLLPREVDLPDPGIRYEARSSLYRWARRSMSRR
jgi:hypothetical protein